VASRRECVKKPRFFAENRAALGGSDALPAESHVRQSGTV
jgi:hypothetical protein